MIYPPDDPRKLVERLRDVLMRKGYRESCDIPACNCGDNWNHGGHAETRLHEIADELGELTQGTTVLQAVKRLLAENEALREDKERLEWLEEIGGHKTPSGDYSWLEFSPWPLDQSLRAAIDAARREGKS